MNESKELFAAIAAGISGIFSITASLLNWDLFFNNRKAQLFLSFFGRTGARIFYGLLGLGLVISSVVILVK